MNTQSTRPHALITAHCSEEISLCLSLFSPSPSLTTCHAFFAANVGSWAERIPTTVYVCVCVSGSVCFIAYGGMKSLQSPKAHWAPLYPDTQLHSIPRTQPRSAAPSPPPCARACFFQGVIGARMCGSSRLVAHPRVPTATFIPTSEPSAHQSLSPSALLRRVTDTRRR